MTLRTAEDVAGQAAAIIEADGDNARERAAAIIHADRLAVARRVLEDAVEAIFEAADRIKNETAVLTLRAVAEALAANAADPAALAALLEEKP